MRVNLATNYRKMLGAIIKKMLNFFHSHQGIMTFLQVFAIF